VIGVSLEVPTSLRSGLWWPKTLHMYEAALAPLCVGTYHVRLANCRSSRSTASRWIAVVVVRRGPTGDAASYQRLGSGIERKTSLRSLKGSYGATADEKPDRLLGSDSRHLGLKTLVGFS
jgi:hypothetical protein